MTTVYAELAERFRGEIEDIDLVVQRALYAWERVQLVTTDQNIYLDAAALNPHSFYSGLERLFELVARHLDRNLPTSETWHRDLLQAMAQDVTEVRPALIDPDSANALDEFRRFRHLVRNIYTTHLVPARMDGLLQALPNLWLRLKSELLAFADFLDGLAEEPNEAKLDRDDEA
ncbi:MAG: hypothetical protein BroJett011_46020 [Chloroflexota bacterium]|nr:MAG: hypothetical protein BroJett011_46020 [Chloroflexota bacterium]